MSHAERVSSAIARAAKSDPKALSALYIEKISNVICETLAEYDPSLPKDQPHIFLNDLEKWSSTTNRVAKESSDANAALELSIKALLDWAALRNSWSTKPGDYAHRFTDRTLTDPLTASTQAIEETKRRADIASHHAARAFYRLARQNRGTAIAVLDEMSPRFEENENHLKGVFDHVKVKQSLVKHATPGDSLTAQPKVKKDIIPVPPGFF